MNYYEYNSKRPVSQNAAVKYKENATKSIKYIKIASSKIRNDSNLTNLDQKKKETEEKIQKAFSLSKNSKKEKNCFQDVNIMSLIVENFVGKKNDNKLLEHDKKIKTTKKFEQKPVFYTPKSTNSTKIKTFSEKSSKNPEKQIPNDEKIDNSEKLMKIFDKIDKRIEKSQEILKKINEKSPLKQSETDKNIEIIQELKKEILIKEIETKKILNSSITNTSDKKKSQILEKENPYNINLNSSPLIDEINIDSDIMFKSGPNFYSKTIEDKIDTKIEKSPFENKAFLYKFMEKQIAERSHTSSLIVEIDENYMEVVFEKDIPFEKHKHENSFLQMSDFNKEKKNSHIEKNDYSDTFANLNEKNELTPELKVNHYSSLVIPEKINEENHFNANKEEQINIENINNNNNDKGDIVINNIDKGDIIINNIDKGDIVILSKEEKERINKEKYENLFKNKSSNIKKMVDAQKKKNDENKKIFKKITSENLVKFNSAKKIEKKTNEKNKNSNDFKNLANSVKKIEKNEINNNSIKKIEKNEINKKNDKIEKNKKKDKIEKKEKNEKIEKTHSNSRENLNTSIKKTDKNRNKSFSLTKKQEILDEIKFLNNQIASLEKDQNPPQEKKIKSYAEVKKERKIREEKLKNIKNEEIQIQPKTLHDRTERWMEKKTKKQIDLKIKKEEKEVIECTFQPKINRKSQIIYRSISNPIIENPEKELECSLESKKLTEKKANILLTSVKSLNSLKKEEKIKIEKPKKNLNQQKNIINEPKSVNNGIINFETDIKQEIFEVLNILNQVNHVLKKSK